MASKSGNTFYFSGLACLYWQILSACLTRALPLASPSRVLFRTLFPVGRPSVSICSVEVAFGEASVQIVLCYPQSHAHPSAVFVHGVNPRLYRAARGRTVPAALALGALHAIRIGKKTEQWS